MARMSKHWTLCLLLASGCGTGINPQYWATGGEAPAPPDSGAGGARAGGGSSSGAGAPSPGSGADAGNGGSEATPIGVVADSGSVVVPLDDAGNVSSGDSGGGGAPDAAGVVDDGGGNPYGTPPQCSSGQTGTTGQTALMQPGSSCASCHKSGSEANSFTIAGTVYKTAHEPTSCNGVSVSGATVVISGANGATLTLAVNAAGNFMSTQPVALPYQAKVVYAGGTLAMRTQQTVGDCNSCHTQSGASGAPGRIMLP